MTITTTMSTPPTQDRSFLFRPPVSTQAQVPSDTGRTSDIRVVLSNLADVQKRMDSLQRFLSESINRNTLMGKDHMAMVSNEIVSAIQDIILNGTALLSCSSIQTLPEAPVFSSPSDPTRSDGSDPEQKGKKQQKQEAVEEWKVDDLEDEELKDDDDGGEDCEGDSEIVEPDAMELLAEHIHFCEICGKGFKRDANLRMHMRAHGNQFKTPEALAKPTDGSGGESARVGKGTRFSCPFVGCNRNKAHKKFRPLKSVICVKNHFKRSHCPKMYSCNRCHKKSFSVLSDLRSHLKHCGEAKWKCSCGTTFTRKDKLFGHMALFEGHMPAVAADEEEKVKVVEAMDEEENEGLLKEREYAGINVAHINYRNNNMDNGSLEGFFDDIDGFGSIENYCLQDVLGFSNSDPFFGGVY